MSFACYEKNIPDTFPTQRDINAMLPTTICFETFTVHMKYLCNGQ